jgi:ribose 5-phosphate isomerase B
MRVAMGSDETTHLTDAVREHLESKGIDLQVVGPLQGRPMDWVEVARDVAGLVASGDCQWGLVFCWTGTGVSIAANKVPGIRAALCGDAETARGARRWNDANVLAMSLRATPEAVAREICDAWMEGEPDPSEKPVIEKIETVTASR